MRRGPSAARAGPLVGNDSYATCPDGVCPHDDKSCTNEQGTCMPPAR